MLFCQNLFRVHILLITGLFDEIISIFIPPYFIDAHGKLVVSMGHDCLKVKFLLGLIVFTVMYDDLATAYLEFREGLLFLKDLVKVARLHLPKADQGHVNSLVVGVRGELILTVLVVQVGNVIVANAGSFVVLAAEEHAGLGKVDQGDHVRLLLHEIVLSELVVGDQVSELDLQCFDLLAFAT